MSGDTHTDLQPPLLSLLLVSSTEVVRNENSFFMRVCIAPRSLLEASSGHGIKSVLAVSVVLHACPVNVSFLMASNAVLTWLFSASKVLHSAGLKICSRSLDSFVVLVVSFVAFSSLNLMFDRGHSVTMKSRG